MEALKFRLSHIKCVEETNEVGSDEPYVLVFIGANLIFGPDRYNVTNLLRYGPFNNTDKGERKPGPSTTLASFFDTSEFLNMEGRRLARSLVFKPEDFFVIIALIEHDHSSLTAIYDEVRKSLTDLYNSKTSAEKETQNQEEIKNALLAEMRSSIKRKINNDWVNDDEIINIKHLDLRPSASNNNTNFILEALNGNPQLIGFTGQNMFKGDGGRYEVFISLKKED